MRTFTASGTVVEPNLPFSGLPFRATWTDGVVTVEGIDVSQFRAAAETQAEVGLMVGHPCGPFYKPDDWADPTAFLWWCRWIAKPTIQFEGGEWLTAPKPKTPGIEEIDWVR